MKKNKNHACFLCKVSISLLKKSTTKIYPVVNEDKNASLDASEAEKPNRKGRQESVENVDCIIEFRTMLIKILTEDIPSMKSDGEYFLFLTHYLLNWKYESDENSLKQRIKITIIISILRLQPNFGCSCWSKWSFCGVLLCFLPKFVFKMELPVRAFDKMWRCKIFLTFNYIIKKVMVFIYYFQGIIQSGLLASFASGLCAPSLNLINIFPVLSQKTFKVCLGHNR